MKKPGQYASARRRSSYRKVLFSLAMTCNEHGYWTLATNEQIAEGCGLSESTVATYIREMQYDGTIITVYWDSRVIVFTDHPDSREYVRVAQLNNGNVGLECYEGSGPMVTGRWPKCRVTRDLSYLVQVQK